MRDFLLHREHLKIFCFSFFIETLQVHFRDLLLGNLQDMSPSNKGEILRLAGPSQTLPMDMQYSTSGISATAAHEDAV